MTKIKICGIRREKDIEYINELKPDYIGFILSQGFRRSIDRSTARRLREMLSPEIKAVGVFVNESAQLVRSFVDDGIIDIVQLHGNETPQYCDELRDLTVIKYFNSDSFGKIGDYDVDYYLFDSGTGTGRSFDWADIPQTDVPFFLAGGIGAHNIERALREVNPYCIDLSSAVETDGFKDYDKIKEIMEIIR